MRPFWLLIYIFAAGVSGVAADGVSDKMPTEFVLGRHTFFDFGPPSDFYELYLVRGTSTGTSVERITLTPPADTSCLPAKVETAFGVVQQSITDLLSQNPCAIPQKDLERESKRCKKCLVFSGANVVMRVQCGSRTRMIRADILDQDLFDPHPNTPRHTSWTMGLLDKLNSATGPDVMQRPIFPTTDDAHQATSDATPNIMLDLAAGKFDSLFKGAPDKPSELYRAAQKKPPTSTVELVSSEPSAPEEIKLPKYPPLARAAHIEGVVAFTVEVSPDGSTDNFTLVTGHPMLREAVKEAVTTWKFPREDAGRKISGGIVFRLNCPASTPR